MSEHVSFVDRVLAGDVLEPNDEIDDAVAEWHASDSELELHQWLGMTDDEYNVFLTRPSALTLIIQARRWGKSLDQLDSAYEDLPIAARSAYSNQIARVREWLKETGRA